MGDERTQNTWLIPNWPSQIYNICYFLQVHILQKPQASSFQSHFEVILRVGNYCKMPLDYKEASFFVLSRD